MARTHRKTGMDAYLDKIFQPEVLFTLFAVFILGRITAGQRARDNGLSPTPPAPKEIKAALDRVIMSKWLEIDAELDAHKKIRAIKLLRNATGLGLKDSKHAIEERERKRDLRLH
nr:ribosomal protein L7/L12 [uncultured Hyphomonas sp.]